MKYSQQVVYCCMYFIYFCPALKLDADNMSMVLKEAHVDEGDWKDVATALGLSQGIIEGWIKKGMSWFGMYGWKDVLNKWREQESSQRRYISWDKLAEAVQNVKKYGVRFSQTILEISGEGTAMHVCVCVCVVPLWGEPE